jgi:hypothetical protein
MKGHSYIEPRMGKLHDLHRSVLTHGINSEQTLTAVITTLTPFEIFKNLNLKIPFSNLTFTHNPSKIKGYSENLA